MIEFRPFIRQLVAAGCDEVTAACVITEAFCAGVVEGSWKQRPQPEPKKKRLDIPAGEWFAIRSEVFKRDGYKCQYCGGTPKSPHCDHIIPLSRGGKSTLDNLTTACRSCNIRKGDKTPEEWVLGGMQ